MLGRSKHGLASSLILAAPVCGHPTVPNYGHELLFHKSRVQGNNDDEAVRGVVFYLDGKRVVGVLLYNVFGMGIDIARKIIADKKDHDDFSELAKLFDLHTPQKEDEAPEDAKKE